MYYLMLPQQELYAMIVLQQELENKSWVDGSRFDKQLSLLEFVVGDQGPFTWCDYFRPAANIPLFSPRMKGWLEAAGVDNIDYYPASVTQTGTGETRPYHAANILGQVRGMAADKSDYVLFDEDSYLVEEFHKLVLDETKFRETKICRLAEFDLLVVAHLDLKTAVEAGGAVGVSFLVPDEWDGFAT